MAAETVLVLTACVLLLVGAGAAARRGARLAASGRLWDAALLSPLGAALAIGGALVWRGLRLQQFPVLGGMEAVCWYALAVTVSYVCVSVRQAVLRPLGAVLLPYAAVVLGLAVVLGPGTSAEAGRYCSGLLGVHVLAAFAGYGMFTVESVLALAYLVQDHCLKRKRTGILVRELPPLEVLDRVMQELIGPAFLLFTVSVGMGVWLAVVHHLGTRWVTDAKVVATGATWLVYGVLFTLRRGADHHGSRLAWVALLGFSCVLATFLGVHVVTTSLHGFGSGLP